MDIDTLTEICNFNYTEAELQQIQIQQYIDCYQLYSADYELNQETYSNLNEDIIVECENAMSYVQEMYNNA